jgi:hypothetical protein
MEDIEGTELQQEFLSMIERPSLPRELTHKRAASLPAEASFTEQAKRRAIQQQASLTLEQGSEQISTPPPRSPPSSEEMKGGKNKTVHDENIDAYKRSLVKLYKRYLRLVDSGKPEDELQDEFRKLEKGIQKLSYKIDLHTKK